MLIQGERIYNFLMEKAVECERAAAGTRDEIQAIGLKAKAEAYRVGLRQVQAEMERERRAMEARAWNGPTAL